jgi:hypothetical protein
MGKYMQVDVVLSIATALNREESRGVVLEHPPCQYVNMLVVPEGSAIEVDAAALASLGITRVERVQSHADERGRCFFDADKLVAKLQSMLVDVQMDAVSLDGEESAGRRRSA